MGLVLTGLLTAVCMHLLQVTSMFTLIGSFVAAFNSPLVFKIPTIRKAQTAALRQNWLQLLVSCGTLVFTTTPACAQIIPDNTLGAESSRLAPNVVINGASADSIDGGAQRGSNLFHSFSQFNVNDGQRVYFVNPSGVENILTRVTGGQGSNIFGTLGVEGNANLFLINPNGIVFGKNAQLDVRGSFVASTANALRFGEQGIFSATNPQAPPLLTINPSALLFNQLNQGAIANQSQASAGVNQVGENVTGLRVPDGKSLLLVGGNINIDGGGLRAYGGNIELAALAAPGDVGLNVAGDSLGLAIGNEIQRADVSLSNGAEVNVRGADGGSIKIHARDVSLAGESKLRAGIETGLGTPDSKAGNIEINATGTTTLTTNSFIANVLQERAFGKAGDIIITTGSLNLTDEALLNTSTYGQGDGGNIFIQAADSVSLISGYIFNNVTAGAVGNGGNINIKSGSFSLTDAVLGGGTVGKGDAGNIFIQAADSVSLVSGDIFNNVEAGAVGNGGNINIKAGSLSLTDSAQLQVSINRADGKLLAGRGDGGNVNIDVRDAVTFAKPKQGITNGIIADVDVGAIGNGGNVNINAGSLTITDGSEIQASTRGRGNSGNITINTRDTTSLDGRGDTVASRIINSVQPEAEGNAGDIQLTTGSLSLTNGAYLNSSTSGKGNGGNITINARDTISLDRDSNARSFVGKTGVGKGGDIQVTTGTLSLTNSAQISTNVLGEGNAGNININARDTIKLDGIVGGISSDLLTRGVGKGGEIRIETGGLSVTNGAQISSFTDGQGDAGNISINARDTITFDGVGGTFGLPSQVNSDLRSNGVGNAGDIRLTGRALFLTNGGQISATDFGQGNAGNVTINARDTVKLDGKSSSISTSLLTDAISKGGDIQITTGSLFVTNGANLFSGSAGQGNAGNITIDARDRINVENSRISSGVSSTGKGNGGNIRLRAGSVSFSNQGQLSTSTFGQGNAGNIRIEARDSVSFVGANPTIRPTGVYSTLEEQAQGRGGDIEIIADSLSLTNGAQLSAGTFGKGDAGNITIKTTDSVFLSGSSPDSSRISGIYSTVGNNGQGKGGNIDIFTGTLAVTNSARLNASTSSRGDAGNISVRVDDAVTLTNSSEIRTNVESNGVGTAGDIDIFARSVSVTDGSQILSGLLRSSNNLPAAQGRGGNVRVTATNSVTLSGIRTTGFSSGLWTSTDRGASGKAGNITVNTGQFRVTDAAVVSASTSGFGDGGNITINANSFEAVNGGQVITNTNTGGKAGTITLNTRDNFTLAGSDPNYTQRFVQVKQRLSQPGVSDQLSDVIYNQDATSGIFALSTSGSTGLGGSIFINSQSQVTLADGAKISVNSDSTGNAGDITLVAGFLSLNNKASISAQTASSQGGNINLQLGELLLLRRGSQISTTAGTAGAGGDGGNITINTPFIIALPQENSDISANAYSGRGGNINITAQSIFGIQARPFGTSSSDITASSELGVQGQIFINQPEVERIQGIIELPASVLDASNQIAQNCATQSGKSGSSFYITGKGGLPVAPGNLAVSYYPTGEVRSVVTSSESDRSSHAIAIADTDVVETSKLHVPIVEAQGLVKTADGQIVLVAFAPQVTPGAFTTPAVCPVSQ